MPPARPAQHDGTAPHDRTQHDHVGARLLLAAAAGALLAAGVSLATAPDEPAVGVSAPAVVRASAGCAGGGQDTVSVTTARGEVTTRVDACGQLVGSTISVQLAPDGSVGPLVALAGTRAADGPSVVPVAVLLTATVLTAGVGAASLRARREARPPG